MGWLGFSGRCNQQQYWVMAALLLVSPILAGIVHLPVEGSAAFWGVLYARRLHDFGKTLWWAVGVILLSLIPVALLGVHAGDDPGHGSFAYYVAMGSAFLIQHCFTVWLGLQKGDEGPNRFGLPQKTWGAKKSRASSRGEPTIWEARLWEDDEPRPQGPSIWEARSWEDDEPRSPITTPASPAPRPSRIGAQLPPRDARPVFGRRPAS